MTNDIDSYRLPSIAIDTFPCLTSLPCLTRFSIGALENVKMGLTRKEKSWILIGVTLKGFL